MAHPSLVAAARSVHRRVASVWLVLLLCVTHRASAQSGWAQSVPPGMVLRFQPRTFEQAMHAPRVDDSGVRPLPSGILAREAARVGAAGLGTSLWQEWSSPARAQHALVLDTRRHLVFLVGGEAALDPQASVWTSDVAMTDWTLIATRPGGAAVVFAGAVYDSVRDRLLVLGWQSSAFHLEAFLPATGMWMHLWDGPAMTQMSIAGLAIDTRRDELALLGVYDAVSAQQQMFRIALSNMATWHAEPITSPVALPVVTLGSAVYEPAHDRFDVVFDRTARGYFPGFGVSSATLWSISAGDAPAATAFATPEFPYDMPRQVMFDAATGRVLLVSAQGETFAVRTGDGTAERLDDGSRGLGGPGVAACFDARDRRILGGGGQSTVQSMPAFASLPVDSPVDAPVGLGQGSAIASQWLEARPGSMGSRIWHSSMIDPLTGRQVVFGGWVQGGVRDLVVAHPISAHGGWLALGAGSDSMPRPRFAHSLVYDPAHHAMLVFGGQAIDGTGDLLGDLWSLSLDASGTWTRLHVSNIGPGQRRNSSLVYDTPRHRFVLMGGDDLHAPISDAWELTLDGVPTWRPLGVAGDIGLPYPMVFTDSLRGDGWSYAFQPGFTPLRHVQFETDTLRGAVLPVSGQAPEMSHVFIAMTFDARHRRAIAFYSPANGVSNADLGTMWTATLGDSVQWGSQSVPGAPPTERGLFSAVYDDDTSRLLITGGYTDNENFFADAWQLDFVETTAVQVSLMGASADTRGAHLRWYVTAIGATGIVERSSDGHAWQALGAAERSGTDALSFDDPTLAPGVRAAYRLCVTQGAQVTFTAAAWVSRAAADGLALSALPHAPGVAAAVNFTLAGGRDARLRLYDVSGRLRANVTLAPAMQAWAFREPLEPGLYVAELTQGSARRTARVIALR